jgi:hypothetical protein
MCVCRSLHVCSPSFKSLELYMLICSDALEHPGTAESDRGSGKGLMEQVFS